MSNQKPKSAPNRKGAIDNLQSFVSDIEPIEVIESKQLDAILSELFDNILDGDNRAIIRKYQAIKSDESIHNILGSLHTDLKGGDAKSLVFGFMKALKEV